MNKTTSKIKQLWEEILYKSAIPQGASEIINESYMGMFKIHGHYIDELTELIELLETE